MALFRETALGPRPITRGGKTLTMPDKWFFTTGNFIAPHTGVFTFYGWSGGSCGSVGFNGLDGEGNGYTNPSSGGASGGYARKTVSLTKGASVTVSVGRGGIVRPSGTRTPEQTIIYTPGGNVVIPAPSSNQTYTPGAAPTGGDINIRGGFGGYYTGGSMVPPVAAVSTDSGSQSGNSGFAGASGAGPGELYILKGAEGQPPFSPGSGNGNATFGQFPGGGAPGIWLGSQGYSSPSFGYAGAGGDGVVIVIAGEHRTSA